MKEYLSRVYTRAVVTISSEFASQWRQTLTQSHAAVEGASIDMKLRSRKDCLSLAGIDGPV